MLITRFELEYAYNQFLVFDSSIQLPGNDWTQTHFDQGFARRDSSVAFRTLYQFGLAAVEVFSGNYIPRQDERRVVAVPFESVSGDVMIEGPEGSGSAISLTPGHYNLTSAQATDEETGDLFIRLFFTESEIEIKSSRILVADRDLSPPDVLLEGSEISAL